LLDYALPLGEKALAGYLGADRALWRDYDATALVESRGWNGPSFLVDQGTNDQFLESQLKPELLKEACTRAGYPWTFACRRVTTIATSSSRASSKITFDSMRAICRRRRA